MTENTVSEENKEKVKFLSTPKNTGKKRHNYLNNKDLLADTLSSLENDKMSDQLAHKLKLLVTRYARHPLFVNATYREDMEAYALLVLATKWKMFKPEKSHNAFAFFTQCTKNAFVQYWKTEKNQRNIRDRLLVDNGLNPSYTYTMEHENAQQKPRKVLHEEIVEETTVEDLDDQWN